MHPLCEGGTILILVEVEVGTQISEAVAVRDFQIVCITNSFLQPFFVEGISGEGKAFVFCHPSTLVMEVLPAFVEPLDSLLVAFVALHGEH